ncbi:MAG TPA: phospholipase C, phosphocholine-specific, partial [Pirellulales bacterium]
MQSRRDFLKHAAAFSGAVGLSGLLPAAIQKAQAIVPEPGSTYLDAEHVVILMQENRSFDHSYGSLRGVRGFNDPRAIRLADGNPVWVQTNDAKQSYSPFRLNIKDTQATWMGCLPHSWTDQVDARNGGKYDKWLQSKQSGEKRFADMPLTMGYYNREDIPFYYAMGDAFTICDQHFCSSLTGTTANRLYLWTGTIREKPSQDSHANVLNSDVDYEHEASWTTFPERLEEHGVSWKIYQNELSLDVGFSDEEAAWLANFGDNPIEYFSQFNVRYLPTFRKRLQALAVSLAAEVAALEKQSKAPAESPGKAAALAKTLAQKNAQLQGVLKDRQRWTEANFNQLSALQKNLYEKAFCTNTGDPHYRELETLKYKDGDAERSLRVPKGDVLHQFRQDVETGKLPTVSWLVAPAAFSDHPGSAWFGAWYIAEALEILTKNPEVWKKTIFLLTYDENDGYFDHVPPFVAPDPRRPETGAVSKGADATVEFVPLEQDRKRKPANQARESPIGLGYRVPLVIASPWSRGGSVCSQVFDHTSPLQFLEKLLSHKTGKKIE